jgi:hypothetical protein
MWTYEQKTGTLSHNNKTIWHGYSGHGEGLNNPVLQAVANVGPIPCGEYDIGAPYDSERVGPYALPLTPRPETNTFGRSYFRFHGDKKAGPANSASTGCLIFPRAIRELVHGSWDNILLVVSGLN